MRRAATCSSSSCLLLSVGAHARLTPFQASGGDLGTTYQDVSARPCYVQNVPSPRFGRGLDKMANDRLRSAMAKAGKDIANLADAAAVAPKTGQRWLAGRVPHPRHRWVIASLVEEDEG